ncbi:hypothetical protein [Flavobacterium subsaxonicum]|uniref:hypothetical protein n=1 Tax=Flavobacterium subsaxonicum TaxID=426226 RepID=UPI00041E2A42|nr:hypothetical protein [Flavobacterium subsaxonicum]
MAIIVSFGKKVITTDYNYSEKYWTEISRIIETKIGSAEIKDSDNVDELLKMAFNYFCGKFEELILSIKESAFYVYVSFLHEESLELYQKQLERISIGINESDFAISRRILKIIMEQGCRQNLIGCPNFMQDIKINHPKYDALIEELLYLGEFAYSMSENIARNQLFPGMLGVSIDKGELTTSTYQPYPTLLKYIEADIPKHDSHVAVSQSINEFKKLLQDEFNIDYDKLTGFIGHLLSKPEYSFGLSFIDNIIALTQKQFGYDKEFLKDFYSGLTLSADNALSIQDCILKNQDIHRYIYRPIIKLLIDDKEYYMIRPLKWAESMMTLSTNAFPFSVYPEEWKKYRAISKFVNHLDNTHDKILEEPIAEILSRNNLFFDTGVESFLTANKTNVNISKTVGDIDILFIDPHNALIYICEAKHNRSRFDYNNWKRDYTHFKGKYEEQLSRKIKWAEENKNVILEHFQMKFGPEFKHDILTFNVRGIFVINAPTIYMYNGNYRALTIRDVENLVAGKYIDAKFEFVKEGTDEKYLIKYPYFDNIRKIFG